MSKYNGKNKERRKLNRRPIEHRSDVVCSAIIQELFSDEVAVVNNILSERVDYSKIDIILDDGLVFIFHEEIDNNAIKELRRAFHSENISHKFNGQELIIYK